MFDQVKGYATRETAAKKLAQTIAQWPADHIDYINRNSMIVALPNGRFAAAVRFSNSDDKFRSAINSLMFCKAQICLF